MLKYVLLAGAMTIAAPALAQSQTTGGSTGTTSAAPVGQTAPGRTPVTGDSAPPAPDSATAPAQTADGQTTAQTAPAPTAPAADGTAVAATAPAAPVSKADQVAQVVNAEFPSYDKDSNGALSTTEFSAWMVALRSASDPKAKPGDPAIKTWATQAFAQADKDKSKSVSKTELEGFLAQAG